MYHTWSDHQSEGARLALPYRGVRCRLTVGQAGLAQAAVVESQFLGAWQAAQEIMHRLDTIQCSRPDLGRQQVRLTPRLLETESPEGQLRIAAAKEPPETRPSRNRCEL